MVVTGDRDAYQLVTDGVRIMTTSRGITDTKVYDRQGVIDRYGIPPELVPDFIGLKGDTSDNIPGVPGIGDKTAAELLQRFGSLEAVLDSVDEISGAKRKQNLTEHAEDARVSKRLATMVRDVPVEIDLKAELDREPDRSRLREIFREYELRDPLRRLEEALDAAESAAIPRPETATARAVATRKGDGRRRRQPLRRAARAGRHRARRSPRASSSRARAAGASAPTRAARTRSRARWRTRRSSSRPPATGRSSPTTPRRSARCRATSPGTRRSPPTCSTPRAAATRSTSWPRSAAWPSRPRTRRPRLAVLAHELAGRQREQVVERGLEGLLREIELPLVRVLRECEKAGVKIDTEQLEQFGRRIRADAAELEREIWDLAGEEFMIGSTQQLAEVLFVKLGLSRKRRGKTGFSTDARVLQAIRDEHPIIPKIERWRELTKLAQTYLEQLTALGPDGRLHTTLQQTNTATGRLSSINPNLQNIPIRTETGREIRACFVAEPGNLLTSIDYCQVELRVLAHIAGEDVLKEIFKRGEDVHTETAAAVFDTPPDQLTVGMRSKAKMVNYGIVYGLSAYGLADRLRIPQEEAQEFIDRYLERFPAVAQFMKDAVTQAEEARLRLHALRPPPPGAGDPRPQLADAQARRAARGQLDHPGHRRRHHQGGDGPLPRRAGRRGAADAGDPADPRRAALRGPRGGGAAGDRDRLGRDGGRGGPRPAARGRRGLGPELAQGEVTTAEAAPAAHARREGMLLAAALLLAAVALRPQLVGAGPLIPDIQDDLGVSHAVAGLVGTIPVLCMGLFAPFAGLVAGRWGLRAAMAGCLLAIAVGRARAAPSRRARCVLLAPHAADRHRHGDRGHAAADRGEAALRAPARVRERDRRHRHQPRRGRLQRARRPDRRGVARLARRARRLLARHARRSARAGSCSAAALERRARRSGRRGCRCGARSSG